MAHIESETIDRDERLGEAIEAYLALAESGDAPDSELFAAGYPDLSDDLREALDGLAMVRGLVGDPGGSGRTLETGRRVAGYRIVRELGRGGMGVVYEAVHVDLDRPVALKVLGSRAAPDSTSRRRFLNEAKTAAALHHTHIVPVFDVGQVGGLCYYAMQRIEGAGLDGTLKSMRRDRSRAAGSTGQKSRPGKAEPTALDDGSTPSAMGATASWGGGDRGRPAVSGGVSRAPSFVPPKASAYYRWVAQLGRQAAEALAYAHHSGVIHRDVKPSNLLLDDSGTVWVADFGLARRLADPGLTQSDSLLGTPRYMSPEQAGGETLDARTDVYSLGATLYELLTLAPPFDGKTAAELVRQILHRDPAPPRRADGRIPRDLETIVLKAMSKRPGDRYASASDFAEDLRRFLDMEPVRARRIGPIGRGWRLARRHPLQAAITTASAAAIVAVTAWAFVNIDHERNEALQAKSDALDAQKTTQIALAETRQAVLLSNRAHRESLWREAGAIRASASPDRRRLGLERVREAALMEPALDPEMAVRLRDEAIEFLALRDVEAGVELETGPTWGLAFLDDQTLATLDADGHDLKAWDLQTADLRRELDLRTGTFDSRPLPEPLRFFSRDDGPRLYSGLAAAGPLAAAIWPNGRGVRFLAPRCGAPMVDLELPGRQVDGLFTGPDGRRLVTVERVEEGPRGASLRAVLWDTADDGRPLANLAEPAEPRDQVDRWRRQLPIVAFAPDGRSLAVAWAFLEPEDPEAGIRIFDANDGTLLRTIPPPPAPLSTLTMGPDNALAVATVDGMVRLWDSATATPQPSVSPHHQNFLTSLRFSPDGTLLALAGVEAVVEIWDPATNSLAATIKTPDVPRDLAFSPDGRTLAAACGELTATWRIVEAVGRHRLMDPDSYPVSIAFDPAGPLAIGSRTGEVKRWDPSRGPAAVRIVPGVRAATVIPDSGGRLIAASDEALVRIGPENAVDPIQGAPERPRSRPGIPETPIAAGIAIASGLPGLPRRGPERRYTASVPIALTSDGRFLVLARDHGVFLIDSRHEPAVTLRVEPPDDDGGSPGRGGRGRGGFDRWREIAVAPDGRTLYLLSVDSEIHAWRLDPDAPRPADDPGTRPPGLGPGPGPRDRHRSRGDGPDAPRRPEWTGSSLFASPLAHFQDVNALALSPDGQTLALGGPDGVTRIVDARSAKPLGEILDGGAGPVDVLAFAPDGRRLAVGHQQGEVALWGLSEGRLMSPIAHFPGHRGSVFALAFDPEGRRLASVGGDKMVEVWDLDEVRDRLKGLGLGW